MSNLVCSILINNDKLKIQTNISFELVHFRSVFASLRHNVSMGKLSKEICSQLNRRIDGPCKTLKLIGFTFLRVNSEQNTVCIRLTLRCTFDIIVSDIILVDRRLCTKKTLIFSDNAIVRT